SLHRFVFSYSSALHDLHSFPTRRSSDLNTSYIGGGIYGGGEQAGPPRDTVSYWDGDGVGGSPSVKISLGEQRAYFYKGGVLVGRSEGRRVGKECESRY